MACARLSRRRSRSSKRLVTSRLIARANMTKLTFSAINPRNRTAESSQTFMTFFGDYTGAPAVNAS